MRGKKGVRKRKASLWDRSGLGLEGPLETPEVVMDPRTLQLD